MSKKEREELALLLTEQEERKKNTPPEDPVLYVRWFIERYLWIADINSNLIRFKLNNTQDRIMTIIEALWRAGIPARMVILKARKEGVSTLIEAIGFVLVVTRKLMDMKVVSYDEKSARKIYWISQRFFENLPPDMQPPTKYLTKTSLVFKSDNLEKSLDSSIDVETAKKTKLTRGESPKILHISELAFMDYVKDILLSMRNAVSKTPDSLVVLESTAKGIGNDFHREYTSASTLKEVLSGRNTMEGKSEYVKIFIPWWIHEKYMMKPPDDFKLVNYPHPVYGNEVEEKKAYNLSIEHMYWRRHTILNECGGDLDNFRQEYPANDVEAFISSGRSRFARIALTNYMRKVKPPIAIGEVKIVETLKDVYAHYGGDKPVVEFFEDVQGNLKIWEYPQFEDLRRKKPVEYLLACDAAEGKQVDRTDARKTDNSVISVWRRIPYRKVASWVGKIDPDLLADIAYGIAYYYNMGWLAVENNHPGFTTNRQLIGRYPRLYYEISLDEKTQEETRNFGWHTDSTTRPFLIDSLAAVIREESAEIYDEDTIKEYQTFIKYPDGHCEAQYGCTDDRVMADGIALMVHKLKPFIKNQKEFKSPWMFGYQR